MKYIYGLILLSALLLAATVGETGKVNNPGCPQWAQKYKEVTCE